MKRTVINLMTGALIMGGIMTAVSTQAQDRRGGGNMGSGRAPQTSRSMSNSSSSASRPSVSNNTERRSSSSSVQRQQPQVTQRQQAQPSVQRQQPQVTQRQQSQPQVQRQQPQVSRDNSRQSLSTGRQNTTTSGASHWPNSNSGSVNQGRVTRPDVGTGNVGSGRTPTDNRGTGNVNNNGSQRNDNNRARIDDSRVSTGNHNATQQNNVRNNRSLDNRGVDNRNGNVGGNGNNNRGTGNMGGNGGRRPGDNGRTGNNGNGGGSEHNRTGYGPSNGGINHNGPGGNRPDYNRYSYSSDNRMPYPTRNGDRFHNHYRYNDWSWHSPVRPPHRPYRPSSLWYYRPIVPTGFRFYVSAPVISGVLGLEFGTPFGSSLNFLYYNGYEIDGYYDNIVYLRDVPMVGYVWPDVMLQYDNNGLAFVQFTVSSPYDDRARFNRLYNDLCMSYGTPIRRSGYNGYYSWYGGNGVGYVNLGLTYSGGRYYTSLSFGY